MMIHEEEEGDEEQEVFEQFGIARSASFLDVVKIALKESKLKKSMEAGEMAGRKESLTPLKPSDIIAEHNESSSSDEEKDDDDEEQSQEVASPPPNSPAAESPQPLHSETESPSNLGKRFP
jgi:hypothetical protein